MSIDSRLLQTVFSDIPMVIREADVIHTPMYYAYSNWTMLLPQFSDTFRGKKIPVLAVNNITKGAIEVEAWRYLFHKTSTAFHRKQIIPGTLELLANCPDKVLQKLLPAEAKSFVEKVSLVTGESIDAIRYAQKNLTS